MCGSFNRRDDEFESLRAYNDYLQEVEDLTFNRIYNLDVETTERKIQAYKDANRKSIYLNKSLEGKAHLSLQERQSAEKEQALQRREAARREDEEERRQRVEGRADAITRLANGENVGTVQKTVLKKSGLHNRKNAGPAPATVDDNSATATADTGFTFRGLKQVVEKEPEAPYDPFMGMSDAKKYFVLQEHYDHEPFDGYDTKGRRQTLQGLRKDAAFAASGYDLKEYYSRQLVTAFSGLGVFVGEEIAERDVRADEAEGMTAVIGTAGAVDAALLPAPVEVKMEDDVF